MAPRPRPLLTPPNDGTQKENRRDLRVALKIGAGHAGLILAMQAQLHAGIHLAGRDGGGGAWRTCGFFYAPYARLNAVHVRIFEWYGVRLECFRAVDVDPEQSVLG